MAEDNSGRHRASGRYNPLSELSVVVTRSAEPAVKTSAILAASGGLVAAFALPAQAGAATVDAPSGDDSTSAEAVPTTLATIVTKAEAPSEVAPPAVAPPAVVAPEAAAPAAPVVSESDVLEVEAVAKPEPEPSQELQEAAAEAAAEGRGDEVSRDNDVTEPTTTTTPTPTPPPPAPEQEPPAPAPTGGVLDIAASLVGTPYVYGGTTPAGFDCSGFTQYVFAQVGISLPRTAEAQRLAVTPVSNPQPGDLVFFGAPAYHMGIYAGNGMMYDSPRSGKSVSLRPVFSGVSMYGRVG